MGSSHEASLTHPSWRPRFAGAVGQARSLVTHPAFVIGLSSFLIGLHRAERPLADGDVFWSAKTGQRIAATARLPHHDPFSWTAAGATWVPNSWGWDVVLGVVDRVGGLPLVAWLGVLMTVVLGLLLWLVAEKLGAAPESTGITLQIVGGLFGVFLYARPQIVDYIAIVVFYLLVPKALSPHGARAFIGVVLFQAAWMNLHSAALIGPIVVAALATGRVVASHGQGATRAISLIVMCGLACLATPYGIAPLTHAGEVRAASAGLIVEWGHAGIATPEQILALIAVLIAGWASFLAWRRRHLDMMFVLLVLAVAAWYAVRFAPIAVFAALPTLAATRSAKVRPEFMRRIWWACTALLSLLCVLGAHSFADPGAVVHSGLVAKVPKSCRIVNDIDIGGQLIHDRADVPVFFDSRNDMYGRAREIEALVVLGDGNRGTRFVEANNVDCVLAPSRSPLVASLRAVPGWQVLGSDSLRTLLARTKSASNH